MLTSVTKSGQSRGPKTQNGSPTDGRDPTAWLITAGSQDAHSRELETETGLSRTCLVMPRLLYQTPTPASRPRCLTTQLGCMANGHCVWCKQSRWQPRHRETLGLVSFSPQLSCLLPQSPVFVIITPCSVSVDNTGDFCFCVPKCGICCMWADLIQGSNSTIWMRQDILYYVLMV